MPLWLLLLGGGALFAYLVNQGQQQAAQSPFAVGQTVYLNAQASLQLPGFAGGVTIQPGTRVYVQTSDATGSTMIRTDSGNVGTVPTASLSATLPPGITMQVN